jgi:NADH:ubiquinone oxidoreductase subunit 6 (subunit J)
MNLPEILYYFFIALAALSSIAIIFVRNVLYAALLLIVTLLSVAALYILLFAEFVAVTQILIYAGGILVIILFGIMLSTRLQGKPLMVGSSNLLSATIIGLGTFSLIVFGIRNFTLVSAKGGAILFKNQVNEMGVLLMTDWLLPFEVAGILLLIVLVGASNIASTDKEKN